MAGLTVVDPMTAVGLGIAVLGEADAAPPAAFAGFLAAGAAAVAGVWLLARPAGRRRSAATGGPSRMTIRSKYTMASAFVFFPHCKADCLCCRSRRPEDQGTN